MAITERNAAKAYARAWNRLDCTEFIELLAPDACYNSQWVLEELEGKESIKNYFTKKLNAVKEGDSAVYAELAVARESFPGRHCVAMAQDNKEVVQSVVIFEVEGDFIQSFDMCMPNLFNLKRSGVYPT